jgi:hypothetical protein
MSKLSVLIDDMSVVSCMTTHLFPCMSAFSLSSRQRWGGD